MIEMSGEMCRWLNKSFKREIRISFNCLQLPYAKICFICFFLYFNDFDMFDLFDQFLFPKVGCLMSLSKKLSEYHNFPGSSHFRKWMLKYMFSTLV